MIWLQLLCNSHFLGRPPRKVEDKIFLPLDAASNTLDMDEPIVVRRVSFGRFGGQEGLVGQAVASSVDLWELDLCVRWFWGCRFLWLGRLDKSNCFQQSSATVGKAMAYVAALGQKAAFCWVSHRRKAGWQASVGRGRGS